MATFTQGIAGTMASYAGSLGNSTAKGLAATKGTWAATVAKLSAKGLTATMGAPIFGSTGILDNFNRANENPLSNGGKWSGPYLIGFLQMQVISNQCSPGGGTAGNWWNVQKFGPDCEVYCDVVTAPTVSSDQFSIGARQVNPGGSTFAIDGWSLTYTVQASSQWQLAVTVSGSIVNQISWTHNLQNGDSVGINCIGNVATAYLKRAGVWSVMGTLTDSHIAAAGYLSIFADSGIYDNFGGGNVAMGWAAAIAKLSPKALTAMMASWTGTLNKSVRKLLAAAMASWAATLTRGGAIILLSLAATMASWTGTLGKFSMKAFAAMMANFAGTLGKFSMKVFAAMMASWTAAIAKLSPKALIATMASWAGTLGKFSMKAFAAMMANFAGTLGKFPMKAFAATMASWAAAIAKLSPKALTAMMASWTGTLNKSAGKLLAAAMANWAATLARGGAILLSLAATMASWTGTLGKLPVKVKAIAATMANFAGTLGKFPMKAFVAVMANWSASIGKSTKRILAAMMASWAATLAKARTILVSLAAAMAAFVALLARFPVKVFAATMGNWAGGVLKFSTKRFAAAMAAWSAFVSIPGRLHVSFVATMSAFSAFLNARWAKILGQSIRLQIFNAIETLLKSTMPAQLRSIRLQIFDALYQLLSGGGGPLNLSIFKERLRPIEKQELPAILIYADDDIPKTLGAQVYKAPLTERQLSLVVECRAQASQTMTADEALDPLLVWAEQVIVQNEQFGGLASGVEELRTVWLSHEGEIPVAAAAIHFTVKYRTARGDLTKKDPKS
jgi:hypothetical protein